jgi:predicted lipoprotein with Yx(FWY)xxD motif
MKNRLVLIILLLAGAILFAGCTMPKTTPTTPAPTTATTVPPVDTIQSVPNPNYGLILVDARGMTLYYFAKDTPGAGTSVCTGTCLSTWPAFSPPAILVVPPLEASNFATFTRADGGKQTTYRGWPLYYYSGDARRGDTNGYGINNVWYVMGSSGVVTLAPTIPTPAPATTIKTTVPTTTRSSWGGGGY